jgi:hypothetical protein
VQRQRFVSALFYAKAIGLQLTAALLHKTFGDDVDLGGLMGVGYNF